MGLFTTRQLIGVTQDKLKFNALFLNLFLSVKSLSIPKR